MLDWKREEIVGWQMDVVMPETTGQATTVSRGTWVRITL